MRIIRRLQRKKTRGCSLIGDLIIIMLIISSLRYAWYNFLSRLLTEYPLLSLKYLQLNILRCIKLAHSNQHFPWVEHCIFPKTIFRLLVIKIPNFGRFTWRILCRMEMNNLMGFLGIFLAAIISIS